MMNKDLIQVKKINEIYMKVECSPSIAYELNEHFSFEIPGARFMPKVKSGMWDGRIKLFSLLSRELYVGLYLYLLKFCKDRRYDLEKINSEYGKPLDVHPITIDEIDEYAKSLNLHHAGHPITLYDHQLQGIYYAIHHKGKLLVSPTGSGKSLMMYVILRYLQDQNKKQLVVVPTTGLVEQLYNDFKDYSSGNKWNVEENCAKIYAGFDKNPKQPIIISTWQSLYELPKQYFQQFNTVIGDEAHTWKAKCLMLLMSKCTETKFKIGTTGTLDNLEINKLILEGLFGTVHKVATTKELMDEGKLSKLKIKIVVLKYPENERKEFSKVDYQSEIQFLIGNERRNKFIRNLALAQEKNSLFLVNRIQQHGQILYDMISAKARNRKVYFIHGGVAPIEREAIRQIVLKEKNAIIIASFGTFQLGVNIPNLYSITFASPSKSKIRNLQSIGRGLRLNDEKEFCTLYDIADDLQWKSKTNFTIKHLLERIDIYNNESFTYNLVEIPI